MGAMMCPLQTKARDGNRDHGAFRGPARSAPGQRPVAFVDDVRARNIGWRIDYSCVSTRLRRTVVASCMRPKVMGSNHCPIVLEMQDL
jgi:endonuclease/exonuclease/phosphatase (EEP) superfamily protein YafD